MKDSNRYHHSSFWIAPKHHIWLTKGKKNKKTDNPRNTPSTKSSVFPNFQLSKSEICFFLSFQFASADEFPLKNLELCGVKADGSCPFCSGGQVWADNCQVCAAETDDYRLYCLSQAQSTLIQQSHLSLIYESLSLCRSLSIPLLYMLLAFSYAPFFLSAYLWSSRHCGNTAVTFPSLNAAKWSRRDDLWNKPQGVCRRVRCAVRFSDNGGRFTAWHSNFQRNPTKR